ncbi:hypothetical protein MCEZEM1_00089 [Comamonadaceae bacterium]
MYIANDSAINPEAIRKGQAPLDLSSVRDQTLDGWLLIFIEHGIAFKDLKLERLRCSNHRPIKNTR